MTATSVRPTIPDLDRVSHRFAWAGIAFPLLFIASVALSNPPADDAAPATWTANYTGTSQQVHHLATGVLLVLASVSLALFLTGMWARTRERAGNSPLALVTAAAGTAAIAVGGVVMAAISGSELIGKYPLPSAELLRFSNDLGFALVAVAGMPAIAVSVVAITLRGRASGAIGAKMAVFGYVVSVALLAAIAFAPIILLLVWSLVSAVIWMRAKAQ